MNENGCGPAPRPRPPLSLIDRTAMSATNSSNDPRLGFVRIVETADGGFVGGILVTNRLGRPLEFQCTTPVRPNRTQAILYGPTLRSFLFGELIGKTLHERLNAKPHLLLVNQPELLSLREHVTVPVGCLMAGDELRDELPDVTQLAAGRDRMSFHPEHGDDRDAAEGLCRQVPADADLGEPLDRVREALEETLGNTAAA